MSIKPNDFYLFAANLIDSTSEIDWRNATSRAYYGAFHLAKESVTHCPDNSHLRMGSHEILIDRFKLHNTAGAKSIAYMLSAMKKLRVLADYEISDSFDKNCAIEQMASYTLLKTKLESFQSSFPSIPICR